MRDLYGYADDVVGILLDIQLEARLLRTPELLIRDNHLGELSLDISYADGSRLSARLKADCSEEFPVLVDYRFHYFPPSQGMRFRYDNSPHYPALATFPHHLHLSTEEVLPYGPPSVRQVAAAVRWHLDDRGQPWNPKVTNGPEESPISYAIGTNGGIDRWQKGRPKQ